MKKIVSLIKKQWLTLWIVIASISLLGVVVYAKYDNSYNMTKRVIAANSSNANFFTSNHLKSGGATPTIYQPTGYSQDSIFNIYTYNYDRYGTSGPYEKSINYQIVAELYDESGNKITTNGAATAILGTSELILYKYGYEETEPEGDEEPELIEVVESTYRFGNDNGVTYTINCTLEPDERGYATNHFSLTIPAQAIDKVFLKMTATPTPQNDYPGLPSISADFSAQTQTVLESSEWTGKFDNSETNLSGGNNANSLLPKDFDGFNYVITGSGVENMRLFWDSTVLTPNLQEMNEYFNLTSSDIANASIDAATGYKYVDITCSAEENGGRYDLQFYIVDESARNKIDKGDDPSTPTPMSWSTLSSLVDLKKRT